MHTCLIISLHGVVVFFVIIECADKILPKWLRSRASETDFPFLKVRAFLFPVTRYPVMLCALIKYPFYYTRSFTFSTMVAGMDVFVKVGDAEKRIKELQDGCTIQLYRRDCKTSAASMKRYPGRAGRANPVLKYYLLEYCCVFGGKTYKSRTTGDRVQTK